ncbi:MAG: hypothetical protein GKR90_20275 [Pseudomonadales bacterium]|nr:hypothetical protein [Pseudomonadales bacterium]
MNITLLAKFAATALVTSIFSGCATADTMTLSPNRQGEYLNTEIPVGWQQVLSSTNTNLSIAEYLPADASEEWVQKLSVEAMSGEQLPDPLEFVDGWAHDQSSLCDEFRDHAIFSGFENGYPSVVRMLVCGKNKRTGKPLVTMIKVIRGNQSLYTITRIWRLETLPLARTEVASWSNALRKTIACNPQLPAHPCPNPSSSDDT